MVDASGNVHRRFNSIITTIADTFINMLALPQASERCEALTSLLRFLLVIQVWGLPLPLVSKVNPDWTSGHCTKQVVVVVEALHSISGLGHHNVLPPNISIHIHHALHF